MQRLISSSNGHIIRSINIKFWNKQKIVIPNESLKLLQLNHPNNCFTLDLIDELGHVDLKNIKNIDFYFYQDPNFDVEVVMEDRLRSVNRAQTFHHFENAGSRLKLNLKENKHLYFAAEFKQNSFVEDDPLKECRNYPNDEFDSYSQCDKKFVETVFEKYFPPGFMPVWATDDVEKVTTSFFVGEYNDLKALYSYGWYSDMIFGSGVSECLLPCKSTEIKTVFLSEKSKGASANRSKIAITFFNTVKVSITDFPKFSLTEFLSSLGGQMGLWLGLGVVQTLDTVLGWICRGMGGQLH